MKITVLSSKSIKPAYAIPPPTYREAIPLTVLDTVNYDQHISGTFFFHPPAPLTAALELGFAMALAEYPEWAGRLTMAMDTTPQGRHRRSILLNDAGARFVEATADVTLDSVMPLEPTPEMTSLHPSPAASGNDDNAGGDGDELMLVQVTRFKCGSLVLGYTWHHHVGDGRAVFNFLVAWGQATRGVAIDPVPVHDRVSFFVPRTPPMVEFEHRGAEFMPCGEKKKKAAGGGVVAARVRFSREMISRLKAQAVRVPRSSRPYSTMACVLGHLWRCITIARRLDGDAVTRLHITVDGRARMRRAPVPPSGYAGNAVLWARPAAAARELVGRSLGHAAEAISMAVAAVDDGYFRSFIDFASSGAVEEEGLVAAADGAKGSHCPDVEVFSLMGLPSGELDLGAGRPFMYVPSYLPEEGLVFVVPSFDGDGSVHAQVSLFSHAMDVFKDCFYSLDLDTAAAAAAAAARL